MNAFHFGAVGLFVALASAMSQTIRPVQHSNGIVVSPANFWSADAPNARIGLGLGPLATLTNVSISNVTGLETTLHGKLATNGSAQGLTNFPMLNQNTTGTANNVTGVVAVGHGGTAATNQGEARTNLGLSWSGLTNATAKAVQEALFTENKGIYLSALAPLPFMTWANSQLKVNMPIVVEDVPGPGIPSYRAMTRTNLGLGATWLTNTNVVAFQEAIGLSSQVLTNITNGTNIISPIRGGTIVAVSDTYDPAAAAVTWDLNDAYIGSRIVVKANEVPVEFISYDNDPESGTIVKVVPIRQTRTFVFNGTIAGGGQGWVQENLVDLGFLGNTAATTRTNLGLGAIWLTNNNVTNFRTAIGLGTSATNNASAFQPASANLTNLSINNASGLTNFPANVLQTSTALTSFPGGLLRTNGSASGLTNFPTLNQNTTGSASNVTGVVALSNGGSGAASAAAARTNFGLGASWLTNVVAPLFWSLPPSSTNSAGTAGQVAYANNYLYICVSSNTWRRVQLGSW